MVIFSHFVKNYKQLVKKIFILKLEENFHAYIFFPQLGLSFEVRI